MLTIWKRYQNLIINGLKWLIFVLAFIYLYKAVFQSQDFDDFVETLAELEAINFWLIGLVAFLMLLNWSLEAIKWQTLLKHIQTVSFFTAFRAVMSGVTVSSILPNRLGEYLGRVFYVPYQKRIKTVIATIVGSFAQTLMTVILGSVAFLFYFRSIQPKSDYLFYLLLAVSIGFSMILLFLYLNVGLINRLIPPKTYLIKFKQYMKVLSYFHSKGLGLILLYAGLRYGVFFIQFMLLLYAFNVPLNLKGALVSIPLNFFTQAVIPTIALTELGVRGATAVHFIGHYAGNEAGILMSTYSLWLINLLIPAFFGAIFLVIQRSGNNQKTVNADS